MAAKRLIIDNAMIERILLSTNHRNKEPDIEFLSELLSEKYRIFVERTSLRSAYNALKFEKAVAEIEESVESISYLIRVIDEGHHLDNILSYLAAPNAGNYKNVDKEYRNRREQAARIIGELKNVSDRFLSFRFDHVTRLELEMEPSDRDKQLELIGQLPKGNRPDKKFIERDIPILYEAAFGQKFSFSMSTPTTPSLRFAMAVLNELKINNRHTGGRPFREEEVRNIWRSRKLKEI